MLSHHLTRQQKRKFLSLRIVQRLLLSPDAHDRLGGLQRSQTFNPNLACYAKHSHAELVKTNDQKDKCYGHDRNFAESGVHRHLWQFL